MRLSHRKRTKSSLSLSMTSMIDVVFLLLIFFIVTSTFVLPEKQLASAIQVNQSDASTAVAKLEPALIDLRQVNRRTVFQLGGIQTNDLQTLKPVLLQFENKSEGAFVRAAAEVPFEAAAQAIALCRQTGFSQVSYLPSGE